MSRRTAAELRGMLAEAIVYRDRMDAEAEQADKAATAVLGDDVAVASGVRRKPNARADAKRWAAYDRAAAAATKAYTAGMQVAYLHRLLAQAEADEAATVDLPSLRPGDLVRTDLGWHRVVRRNAKSVTVETPWSWHDRIPNHRIRETRASA